MEKFKSRTEIDAAPYAASANDPEVFYGLPEEVAFCSSCVISNQRPNSANEFAHAPGSRKATMAFDDDRVCEACRYAVKKETIDWQARRDELMALCDQYRRDDGAYDVLVPGSGGKDSIFAAHLLKHEFAMHPLTVTWAPHLYTDWGWKNFQSWIHAGFDNYLFTPNGRVHRLLTRLAVETIFHPFQPFMMGQKAFAPKLAARLGIPLILYGENPAEHGDRMGDNDSPMRTWSQFTTENADGIYLGGVSVDDLTSEFGLSANDLDPYIPAHPDELKAKDIDVRFLSYYLKWHVQGHYYYAVEHGGFQPSPERTPGTYSKYNSIDDKIDDFHFYTTFIKFGIGRATYESSFEIRNRDLTRDEGVGLVERYDGEFPERFAEDLFEYLSLPPNEFPDAARHFEQPIMDRAYFDHLCDRFRSPHLWSQGDGVWRLRHTVFGG